MGLDENKEGEEKSTNVAEQEKPHLGKHASGTAGDEPAIEEEEDENAANKIQLGPQCTLKEQLEKDKVDFGNFKVDFDDVAGDVEVDFGSRIENALTFFMQSDDESLRKWKEQLLGSVDFDNIGETLEPEVKILSLSIISANRPDMVLSVPEDGKPHGLWFTLKEGSHYNLKFTFQVNNNIVSGLKYTNTVWKTGMKVDSSKEMLGTFSPQPEPYVHMMPEETTPSGLFARGTYSAKTKFLDDDNKCYLEINYTFDIRKEWVATA